GQAPPLPCYRCYWVVMMVYLTSDASGTSDDGNNRNPCNNCNNCNPCNNCPPYNNCNIC
ncbi:MAG: hypothetical protein ACJAZ9_000238, partial [Neolewinella sp.]